MKPRFGFLDILQAQAQAYQAGVDDGASKFDDLTDAVEKFLKQMPEPTDETPELSKLAEAWASVAKKPEPKPTAKPAA